MDFKNEKLLRQSATMGSGRARKPNPHFAMVAQTALAVAVIWVFCVLLVHVSHSRRFYADAPLATPLRQYYSNGYLIVSSNGGLNQMRSGICDMVAIARYMNATLVVPQLDNTSLWQDPSKFEDIFDVDHFINSLRDEIEIVKEIPPEMQQIQIQLEMEKHLSMPPRSWSDISYYTDQIAPERLKKNKILHFEKTDNRLANNGPIEMQKLRCKANYNALKFTSPIEKIGSKVVKILRDKGDFLVLHLRYEKDMLAYTGCNEGCSDEEANDLQALRYSVPWWKKKNINSTSTRLQGLCPMTPEETALTLKALGVDRKTQIYIAAGNIYGGEKRLASLRAAYPNLVKKEKLLPPYELLPFKNYSSQMAAIDYMVSLESDIFFPTYGGNMAKLVEGHRRYLGFKKTIQPNQKALVNLIDKYRKDLNWREFEAGVKKAHANRYGNPVSRRVMPEKPKEEDYFWSNPQECLIL
ncbi:hypothetical protein ABFX02_12G091600 [Erythranthe guttata]